MNDSKSCFDGEEDVLTLDWLQFSRSKEAIWDVLSNVKEGDRVRSGVLPVVSSLDAFRVSLTNPELGSEPWNVLAETVLQTAIPNIAIELTRLHDLFRIVWVGAVDDELATKRRRRLDAALLSFSGLYECDDASILLGRGDLNVSKRVTFDALVDFNLKDVALNQRIILCDQTILIILFSCDSHSRS